MSGETHAHVFSAGTVFLAERVNFVAGVRKGLRELADGKGVSHETVKQEFSEWLLA